MSSFSLMLVDDDRHILSSLKRVFFECDYQIHACQNGLQALATLQRAPVHAALIDLQMPDMDGLSLLKAIRRKHPSIMCVMLTAHGGIREAVEAMKAGALDFLEKPYQPEGLRRVISQLEQLWRQGKSGRAGHCSPAYLEHDLLIGESEPILELKGTIARVALSDASILIQGETGTGKELTAQAIHRQSLRAGQPFVVVDCSAIAESVIESELFGHVKGAFTGASGSLTGLIRAADKGTLYLDEVGELPPHIQPKLLRVLQEREVRPVGSTLVYPVDVRIVASTNKDLEQEAVATRFRRDLYYRLNVITITTTPLRCRHGDIPLLAEHFLSKYRSERFPASALAPEAISCLSAYDWPGNVRELENVIQRAVALCPDSKITPQDLPACVVASCCAAPAAPSPQPAPTSGVSLAASEQDAIRKALAATANNRKEAARLLGIAESTLYRKLKKFGNLQDPE